MTDELFNAIETGDSALVARLVQEDPARAAARNQAGLSAVLAATYKHRHDIAGVLLAAGPELDVFDAAAVGDTGRLAELTDGDPGLATAYARDGSTPLALAAYFAQPAAVKVLLARGADVHARARNDMEVQPLHAAVAGRSAKSVGLLLRAGADPNARQHGGWTPLQAAAAHGDTAMVDLLLAAGADPDEAANDAGATAASLAGDNGHEELAARLSGNRSTTS
ncbi:MAG: ankyrin repeat domain-containing protein [Acidimicrobiales bacterium]